MSYIEAKIKALQQAPKTGNWTALDEWKKNFKGFINELSMPKDDYNRIIEYIDEVPNEATWIPVSKRLPKLDKLDTKVWKQKVLITGYLSFDDKKELFVSEAFINDVINNSIHDTIVTAWMPLPAPSEI